MNVDLKLKTVRNGSKISINCLKFTSGSRWFVFSKSNLLEKHPLIDSELRRKSSNLDFQGSKEVRLFFDGELKEAYIKDNKFYYNNQYLKPLKESKNKSDTFASKLRKLNFNPNTDDVDSFLANFKNLMVGQTIEDTKMYLLAQLSPLDVHLFVDKFNGSLNDIYSAIHGHYKLIKKKELTRLQNLNLNNSESVENLIEQKLQMYKLYYKGISFEKQINSILINFPNELKTKFIRDTPRSLFKTKDACKSYFLEICKQYEDALPCPVYHHEFLRKKIQNNYNSPINQSTPKNNRLSKNNNTINNSNKSNPTASSISQNNSSENLMDTNCVEALEDMSSFEYPNQLDLSAFRKNLNID